MITLVFILQYISSRKTNLRLLALGLTKFGSDDKIMAKFVFGFNYMD